MNKTPTAEEWLLNHEELSVYDVEEYGEQGYLGVNKEILYTIMIEFAKLHVKAALEAAANNVEVSIELSNPYDPESEYAEVNKQSILSAYPESNIK